MIGTRERQKYRGSVQDHRGGGEADALIEAGRLRIATEMSRWLATK
jgi:hypothetical protein